MLFALLLVSCAVCHPRETADFARTPMANSSGKVRAAEEPSGTVEHRRSGVTYSIERKSDALRLRWEDTSVNLDFFIGSRRMGRSYAFLDRGFLYQAPVGYYANKRTWDMAPGYEADRHPDLSRPITRDCLYCHASNVNTEPGTLNRITNWAELSGISCERCHGDGAAHVANPRRGTIVNPARLSRERRSAVCEQCHLAGAARVVLPGKSLDDFRPGDRLSDFLDVFVNRADTSGVQVNGHAEALARSRCAQSSDLWCGSCHNPHQVTTNFNAKCLTCHQVESCKATVRDRANCIGCHMPKGRAYDGGHTVFTDHSIPRNSDHAGRDSRAADMDLASYYTRPLPSVVSDRDLGIAYAAAGRADKAWPLLRSSAQSRPRDAQLYSHVAALLEADNHIDQAIDFYRLAIKIQPELDAAITGLARTLLRKGEKEAACQLARQAFKRNPREPGMNACR